MLGQQIVHVVTDTIAQVLAEASGDMQADVAVAARRALAEEHHQHGEPLRLADGLLRRKR